METHLATTSIQWLRGSGYLMISKPLYNLHAWNKYRTWAFRRNSQKLKLFWIPCLSYGQQLQTSWRCFKRSCMITYVQLRVFNLQRQIARKLLLVCWYYDPLVVLLQQIMVVWQPHTPWNTRPSSYNPLDQFGRCYIGLLDANLKLNESESEQVQNHMELTWAFLGSNRWYWEHKNGASWSPVLLRNR